MSNVPKKVNRHVLKAMNTLSDGNSKKRLTAAVVLNQVKFQMRKLQPVRNVGKAVENSLKQLSECGLIERSGSNGFCIGQIYPPPVTHPSRPSAPTRNLFSPSGSRKRSVSLLDPNTQRRHEDSEDSLSGDEFNRTRKRMHSNNRKLRRSGKVVALPNARQHFQQYPLDYACENCGCLAGYGFSDGLSDLLPGESTPLQSGHSLSECDESTSFTTVRPLQVIQIPVSSSGGSRSNGSTSNSSNEVNEEATRVDSNLNDNSESNEQTSTSSTSKNINGEKSMEENLSESSKISATADHSKDPTISTRNSKVSNFPKSTNALSTDDCTNTSCGTTDVTLSKHLNISAVVVPTEKTNAENEIDKTTSAHSNTEPERSSNKETQDFV